MSKIVYHPGTRTIFYADDVLIFDTDDLEGQGFPTMQETLDYIDVTGIDLGVLLAAVAGIVKIAEGTEISKITLKGDTQ